MWALRLFVNYDSWFVSTDIDTDITFELFVFVKIIIRK